MRISFESYDLEHIKALFIHLWRKPERAYTDSLPSLYSVSFVTITEYVVQKGTSMVPP